MLNVCLNSESVNRVVQPMKLQDGLRIRRLVKADESKVEDNHVGADGSQAQTSQEKNKIPESVSKDRLDLAIRLFGQFVFIGFRKGASGFWRRERESCSRFCHPENVTPTISNFRKISTITNFQCIKDNYAKIRIQI